MNEREAIAKLANYLTDLYKCEAATQMQSDNWLAHKALVRRAIELQAIAAQFSESQDAKGTP